VLFAKYKYNNLFKEDEMDMECSTHWEKMNEYRDLVGKTEGKRSLGRPKLDERTIIRWILEK
jgi:hypothetical protein